MLLNSSLWRYLLSLPAFPSRVTQDGESRGWETAGSAGWCSVGILPVTLSQALSSPSWKPLCGSLDSSARGARRVTACRDCARAQDHVPSTDAEISFTQ